MAVDHGCEPPRAVRCSQKSFKSLAHRWGVRCDLREPVSVLYLILNITVIRCMRKVGYITVLVAATPSRYLSV